MNLFVRISGTKNVNMHQELAFLDAIVQRVQLDEVIHAFLYLNVVTVCVMALGDHNISVMIALISLSMVIAHTFYRAI